MQEYTIGKLFRNYNKSNKFSCACLCVVIIIVYYLLLQLLSPCMNAYVRTFRSPRALSPIEGRENFETTFDLEGNVETVSTASGAREDQRSLGSSSENRFVRLIALNVALAPVLLKISIRLIN